MSIHPTIAQALAPFAPRNSAIRKPEPIGYESGYCASCSGSGEGMYEGTRCHACKGSGEQMYPVQASEPDEDDDEFEGAPV